MDQASIIHDLLNWLDNHLDSPLSLDQVTAKSGYSKWHLQRMFKEITGQAIGTYIRKRRLSKAAIALRLTSRPILEIALQHHFDSQQTFTRAFKKQFIQTPAFYRRNENWQTYGLCPPIVLTKQPSPTPEFVTLPPQSLIGVTQDYTCTLEQFAKSIALLRAQFWHSYLGDAKTLPPTLYGLHHVCISAQNDDEQQVFYTTALEPQHVPEGIQGKPINFSGGKYVKFNYHGPDIGLQDFVLNLYINCLPLLNLTRRKSYDVEIFHLDSSSNIRPPKIINCDYMIPITEQD